MPPLPNIAQFRKRLEELNLQSQQENFFQDRKASGDILREIQRLRELAELHDDYLSCESELKDYQALSGDPAVEPELRSLAQAEVPLLEDRLRNLHGRILQAVVPQDPNDNRNVVMEIRAGTGGDEASLFAGQLHRLYTRYIETHGWKVSVLSSSPSEVGGLKEIIFSVSGDGAHRALKHESGVHRVQRVPVTEANGRIHTSTVTVAVLPEAEEVDIAIDPQDLEISVQRASGAGGQGVNTTDSAVRILHKPTGMMVYCADERSQLKNKNKAMTVLRSRLLKIRQDEEASRVSANRRDQIGSGDRSDKIRTYNFPQNRLTDHRIGLTVHNLPDVMEGRLDEVIEALLKAELDAKLAALANGQPS